MSNFVVIFTARCVCIVQTITLSQDVCPSVRMFCLSVTRHIDVLYENG